MGTQGNKTMNRERVRRMRRTLSPILRPSEFPDNFPQQAGNIFYRLSVVSFLSGSSRRKKGAPSALPSIAIENHSSLSAADGFG